MKQGNELYINNQWYWDILKVDTDNVEVRIKYIEGNNLHMYKNISLPKSIFNDCSQVNNVIHCIIDKSKLKSIIGGLINRLVKSPNIYDIFENVVSVSPGNSVGMGDVSNPGLSGTPGTVGSAGSGDVSSFINFGIEKIPASNMKHIKQITKKRKNKKKNETVLRNPIHLLFENLADGNITDNQFKQFFFEFLDHPIENGYDEVVINSINKNRPEFLQISKQRLQAYLQMFYDTNKAFIDNKTSERLQNTLSKLISYE
jgi:hypothetical protein